MSMIICPECGALISSRANSCVKCGLPIKEIKICPECGKTVLEKTDMFCPECGYPFEEEKTEINLEKDKEDKKYLEAITDIEQIIQEVVARHPIQESSIISNGGYAIADKRIITAVEQSFDVPEGANVFLVVSGNLLGDINDRCKGLAITSCGIEFKDEGKRVGEIFIADLPNATIKQGFSSIKINNFEFIISAKRKVYDLLIDLQDELREWVGNNIDNFRQ